MPEILKDQPQNSKIEILDSLRGFAALSVCLFHFVCTVIGFIQNKWLLNISSLGQHGVQLFFVISGFIIPWSMHHSGYKLKNFFLFLLKRLARLEPPYLFSVVLALTIFLMREKLLGRSNEHMEISSNQIMLHLGYLIPFFKEYNWLNQVYWTLAIEFQYYFLIAFLFVPLNYVGIVGRLLIYTGLSLCSFIGGNEFLPYWLPIFLLGILLFLFKSEKINNKEYYLVTIIILLVCFFKYHWATTLYSLLPIIAVLGFSKVKIYGLHFFGKFSYSLYLIHPLLGASFINIFSHHVNHPLAKLALILAGLFLTVAGSWLTYILVEKPSKKLSASIKY